ncbi:MAG: NusG domain II-containing protein [Oscillospiraceae bacterium]|nr:NusG domain II-containing protein [Oscillospiraceae bacterium]
MSNKRWIILFTVLLLVCAAAALLMPRGGSAVGVWQDGELVYTLDPARFGDYTLRYEAGETVIRVDEAGVYAASADCKNQNCVRHCPLRPGGTPIVCLPERIVVRYMADGTLDAVTG